MQFSKKLQGKLETFRYAGRITHENGMRLVVGREGRLRFYWLVDETDGVIADAKFQAFGPIALLAAAEVASELVLRKNHSQASRISADLIDQHVRDKKEVPAFPEEAAPYLNQVLSAIDDAVQQCADIVCAVDFDITPIERDFDEISGGIPDWETFSTEKKLHFIEEVIDKEIRPYVELDAGGVTVLSLNDVGELLISYQGSCTSCHSATGSTLTAIQQILRARVHPGLTVVPQL